MGNKKLPATAPKTDAFSTLVKYMQDPENVPLNADAETMLKRLMYVDLKMRGRRHTEDDICTELMDLFTISVHTARRDIKNAQKLFAGARSINKEYLAHIHLERLNEDIELTRERLFWEERDETPGVKFRRVPEAAELSALAKLNQVYSQTLNAAPEEKGKNVLPPPIFNFVVVKGAEAAFTTGMSVSEAMDQADQLLNGPVTPSVEDMDDAGEDIDFEELPDGDDEPDSDQ